ncbi:GTP-binding protein [Streptomyces sp. NPDC056347]|uniref:GTP-binding protein n=1 Tax=Streptomyces sp. NPDC056347 TaxID=3345790 RepID=UPI0035D8577C
MTVVNIGILAHIDAGKTTLTERLLFESGAIERLGSVDEGTTRTDSNEIERRRGITIRTAVASFTAGPLQVNLVDTPGHSEFIAEVERALTVLDGAILVVSAVEGIQAQTRLLMKTLRAMALPTLIFINKIDRTGARDRELLAEIKEQLGARIVPLNSVKGLGTADAHIDGGAFFAPVSAAEILAEHDTGLLAELVADRTPSRDTVLARLAEQTAAGLVHPAFFGSARGGQGVGDLVGGIRDLLPAAPCEESAAAQGMVFAIERAKGGEKTAYVRLFKGVLRAREQVTYHRRTDDGTPAARTGRLSSLEVVGQESADRLTPGHIARLTGVPSLRVGDSIGTPETASGQHRFARPILETLVRPRDPKDRVRLHAALMSLAEQDPMIDTRAAAGGDTSVLLYGEIQKEIIAETLLRDFGVEALFEPSQTLYLERPQDTGTAVVEMGQSPFLATIGLRIEAAPPGAGLRFARETEFGALPRAFDQAIQDTGRKTLGQGLYGWPVTDCAVTLVRSGFDNACSSGSDFRFLTPLVLMSALARARTWVFEPCHHFEVELPDDALAAVTAQLLALEAKITDTVRQTAAWLISGEIPARQVYVFTQRLPGITSGKGIWWSRPHGDRRVRGTPPARTRTDGNPLNRQEYLHHLAQRLR